MVSVLHLFINSDYFAIRKISQKHKHKKGDSESRLHKTRWRKILQYLKFDNVAMSSCQINSLQVVDSAWLEGIFSGSLSHHSRNHHLRVLDEASGQLSKL